MGTMSANYVEISYGAYLIIETYRQMTKRNNWNCTRP